MVDLKLFDRMRSPGAEHIVAIRQHETGRFSKVGRRPGTAWCDIEEETHGGVSITNKGRLGR